MAFGQDQELPSYMYAADVHNVANGAPSIVEGASGFTDAITKGAVSAIARGVTSAFNTVPAATNWLGLSDVPEWQTEDLLRSFDNDLAAYYSENRESIDVVGDIAASFIPGMAAIKGLNYAQKGLAGISRGSAGRNLLQSFGALPTAADDLAKEAMRKMASSGNTFSMVDSNVLKAFGTNYAQQALEFGVYELAAASTMRDFSPLFSQHTTGDILANAAWGGGLIGGGLMGTVAAVQTYGAVKRARDVIDKAFNPLRIIKDAPEGSEEWTKILQWKSQLDAPPPTVTEAERKVWDRTQRELNLSIQEAATRMAGGDAAVGALLASSIKEIKNQDAAWAALLNLEEIGSGVARTGIETKLRAAQDAKLLLQDAKALEGLSQKQILALSEKAAFADNGAVKFLMLEGDNALQVTHTAPGSLKLADQFSAKDLVHEVERIANKLPKMGEVWSPVGKSTKEAEARYIKAFQTKITNSMLIHGEDLPHLEAALARPDVERVMVSGVEMDKVQLASHIKTTKEELALRMIDDAAIDPLANTDTIARSLNIKRGMIEGNGKKLTDDSDYFLYKDLEGFQKPSVVKLAYKTGGQAAGVSGDVLSGMVRMKEAQIMRHAENQKAVAAVLGPNVAAQLPVLTDRMVLASTSRGAGAGLLSFASGEYGTAASVVEAIGKVTNRLKTEGQKAVNETFTPLMLGVMRNSDAGNELAALRQTVLSTGEHYVWTGEEAVLKSVRAWEVKVAKGAKDAAKPEIPAGVQERVKLTTQEARDFMHTWVKENDKHLKKDAMLKAAIGKEGNSYGGVIYFPQPDSRKFPFFSLVVPKSVLGEGEKTQMIWASTAEELANLESKVPAGYNILRKGDTERYYKALKEYDYDLGFSSTQLRHDMRRSGIAASFFPKTDPQQLMQELLEWKHRMSDKQIRDAVSLHNQTAFSEFKRLDDNYKSLQTSTKGKQPVDSPYESYVKTALDIPRSNYVPVWTELNNLTENTFSRLYNKAAESFQSLKGEEALAKTNKVLDENGIRGFRDALTEAWANHPAGGRELSRWVMNANGVLSTLLLRTDPMNALNNGVGHMVLTGSETKYVMDLIKGVGKSAEAELLKEAFVGVPGSAVQALSPVKLIKAAYDDYFKAVTKNPEALTWMAKYERQGWMPSMMDQMRSVMDGATLTKLDSAAGLQAKSGQMMKAAGEMFEKVSFNRSVEEMNRFTAARIADRISSLAMKHGKMTEQEQLAFINTFVNRTQGNYLASQRPLLFQGPVGHAISLFQTYSFNILQHIFRHVEQGNKKQVATLLGLQTSIYGLNGLPAFSFLNQHLVGQAAGNNSGQDLYSFAKGNAGDVGDWLLYGSLSNATGLGLYSRGDLNPRTATLVANSVDEIPFVNATRQVLGSIANASGELAQGANVGSTLLRGIEHAGLSRPLAGLATVMQGLGNEEELGYTTSGKNQLMSSWDMYSLASVKRMLGARPYDEAVARDAYHRVQAYDAHRQAQVNTVGSAIRDKVRSRSEVTEEDFDNFLTSYVHAGGNQKNFIKYWQAQVKGADKSQIEALVGKANRPFSQYMQTMMEAPLTGTE